VPEYWLIPPDAIPIGFSVEVKDGDRPLLRLPPGSAADTRLPVFGMMITYHRIDPGETHTEQINLPNLPTSAPNDGSQPRSCTVETWYFRERDFCHDSRQPVPHLEGDRSAEFPGANRLRRSFQLRRLAPTAPP
jgi:hypothetical protein